MFYACTTENPIKLFKSINFPFDSFPFQNGIYQGGGEGQTDEKNINFMIRTKGINLKLIL